jgi:uncharacterized protein YndB with AHSA1/START domain
MTAASTSASVHDTDGHCTLRFERRSARPPADVWRAITARAELVHWFPSPPERDLAPAVRVRFVFPDDGAPDLEGAVAVFQPARLLELTWDRDLLRFDLRPDGDGSVLVFTQTFDDPGRAVRDGAGWHVCLDALAARLEGAAPSWSMGERWAEVHEEYAGRFDERHHRSCVCGGAPAE